MRIKSKSNYSLASLSLFYFLSNSTSLADPLDHYWQQRVDYEMRITLLDSVRQLTGNSIIKYTNQSPDSLDRIYMHLYPCLLYTSPSPRDYAASRMPSSA